MKQSALMEAILELSHERGLDQEVIIEALEDALVGAAYKKYKNYRNIEAMLNQQSGEIELMHFKTVVDEVDDSDNQIHLNDVLEFDPNAELGDELEYPIDVNDFIEVIAQTSRQLVFQKINEAEREMVLEKYKDKIGEILHGTVARFERGRVIVMIGGSVEAMIDRREQIPFEKLQPGDNVRAMLHELCPDGRGPQLSLTRSHPDFLMKLIEVEVPEVFDGIIDVVAAAREPGRRAKVAVRSNDPDVDPVGACVGVRGSRIQAVVTELCGERIDVVEHSEELGQFIVNALAPAEIAEMDLDMEERVADIKVNMDQLSLAIGKQGQNVRLASKLSDVSINISAYEAEEMVDPFAEAEARHEAKLAEQAEAEGTTPEEAAAPKEADATEEAAAPEVADAPKEAAAPEVADAPEEAAVEETLAPEVAKEENEEAEPKASETDQETDQ